MLSLQILETCRYILMIHTDVRWWNDKKGEVVFQNWSEWQELRKVLFYLRLFSHFQVIWAFTRRCHKPQRLKHLLIWADNRWATEVPSWLDRGTGVFCDVTPRECKHPRVFTRDRQLGFCGVMVAVPVHSMPACLLSNDPSDTCDVNWSRGNPRRESMCHRVKVNIKHFP